MQMNACASGRSNKLSMGALTGPSKLFSDLVSKS